MNKNLIKILSVCLLIGAGNIFSQNEFDFKYSFGETSLVSSAVSGFSVSASVGGVFVGTASSENKIIRAKSVGNFIVNNGTAAIDKDANFTPDDYSLKQNYPNPFNPSTIIEFSLPEENFVNIVIYSVLGEKVAEPVNEKKSAGTHKFTWTAAGIPTGIYIYTMRSGNFFASKKLLLLK